MLGHWLVPRISSFVSEASVYWPGMSGKPGLERMIRRATTVEGLTELDLNFPEHVGMDPPATGALVRDCGLEGSGPAMR
jgi:hypothetical protein